MNLGDRLELRDLLLGDDRWRRDLAQLLDPATGDPAVERLAADLRPVVARLHEIVDEHLPLASPAKAVDYALTHASAFTVATIIDYCGVSERRESDDLDAVRWLLFEHVATGRLNVEYMFTCRRCGDTLQITAHMPDRPVPAVCKHAPCQLEQTIDPADARAIYVNTSHDPTLEGWV